MAKKLVIVLIFLLAFFLRTWNLSKYPVSLSMDEAAIGYNAYSILKTGHDEYKEFLPLTFRSAGDYKPPVDFYLTVPSIFLFGLTEFSIRLPVALVGSLTAVAFIYLLINLGLSFKVPAPTTKGNHITAKHAIESPSIMPNSPNNEITWQSESVIERLKYIPPGENAWFPGIPEHLRFVRDQIRATLVSVGFRRLQDSVWIYPYDCEELIILLKADLEIGKDLLYMIVDTLEADEDIIDYFGLK